MRFLKLFAAGIGVLLGLVIVAFIVVALTFDPNDYKDYAQDFVEERTGRSFRIDGDIELSFFPWLAVQTGGVELGNAQGFGPAPFIVADRISARVRLAPLLLRREFEIGTVSVDGLELDLAVNPDGTTNWADLSSPAVQDAESADGEASTGAAAALADLDIEGVQLRGARVVWRDAGAPRFIVSELSLSTGSIAAAAPVDIDVELDVLDVATQRTVHLSAATIAEIGDGGAIRASESAVEYTIADAAGNTDAQGETVIESLEFIPGERLRSGPAQMTNTVRSPIGSGATLAGELGWTSLDIDLAAMNVAIEDLEAAANGVRARWQLVGENLTGAEAILRGSVVFDDSPAASALELAGMTLAQDIDPAALGTFSASGSFVLALDSQDIELSNLNLTMLGIDVRAQQVTVSGDDLAVTAQLDVTPFRPGAALVRLLQPWVPEGIALESIKTIALSTRVSGTPNDFAITGMRFSGLGAELNGQIRLQRGQAGLLVSGDVTTNRFAPNELLAVAGDLMPASLAPETAGSVSASGQFSFATANGALDLRGLRVEAFGMRATGAVTANGVGQSAAEFSGAVQLEDFSPRDLLSRFSLAVPQTSDESALQRANVSTQFEITPTSAGFDELVVNLDDSRITGSFLVSNFESPLYRFDLSADRLDADRYLPPQAPPGADEEPATDDEQRRAGDLALSQEALSAIDVDASINVGALTLAGMNFNNVATNLVVGGGRMLLDSAHADLYGGTFDGRFHVDAASDVPTMLLQGNARRLALAPLITALAGTASFSGTGNFDIDLRGRGPTVTDNLRSAAGTMGFELTNGAIDGFNVDKTLCRAFNRARGNSAPVNQPDRTPFEYIRGTADVDDGIARSNDLIAVAGSAEVRGNGTLALAEQVTDYRFEARLARSVPIEGCQEMDRIIGHDFPLTMKGPLTSPEIAADYSEVIQRLLEYRLREEVRDRLLESLLD